MSETPFEDSQNSDEELLPEYQFDYQKAKPNRFANQIGTENLNLFKMSQDKFRSHEDLEPYKQADKAGEANQKTIHSLSSYRRKIKLLLFTAGFFLLFGILLISTFGSVDLTCERVNVNQVNCSLTRSAVFGFINAQEISLNPLREVKLDKRLKETVEADGDYNTATEKTVNTTPVYGVLLVSNKTTLLNGYAYNREKQEKIANQINSFLNNSNASNLVFQDRNYVLDIATLISLGLSISLLVRMLLMRLHSSRETRPREWLPNLHL